MKYYILEFPKCCKLNGPERKEYIKETRFGLKTLFNIVEARFKKKLTMIMYNDVQKGHECKSFEMYAVTINISMTEYHQLTVWLMVYSNTLTHSDSLICIFILTVQEMFRWKLQQFKISYLPYFSSDFNQIFTVLFEMFYSFYWINLILDRISPLIPS